MIHLIPYIPSAFFITIILLFSRGIFKDFKDIRKMRAHTKYFEVYNSIYEKLKDDKSFTIETRDILIRRTLDMFPINVHSLSHKETKLAIKNLKESFPEIFEAEIIDAKLRDLLRH